MKYRSSSKVGDDIYYFGCHVYKSEWKSTSRFADELEILTV
ncbi:hypothetical protein [Lysinibacillus sp. Bpr_S20]|nr:hypothetical protein [Lysinibacillus sp. Bpr_S20]